MATVLFEVSDPDELRALHRALFSAKFTAGPLDELMPGSSILARMAERVAEAMGQIEGEDRWVEWRRAERHRDRIPVVVGHAARVSKWDEWSEDQRRDYVRILLSPLVGDMSLIDEIAGLITAERRAASVDS